MLKECLNDNDIAYLKKVYPIKKMELFKNSIFKTTLNNTLYYLFTYVTPGENNEEYKIFNINIFKNIGQSENSFWIKQFNSGSVNDFTIISDNPLSLIIYYSKNYNTFRNKKVLLIAPYNITHKALDYIKDNYSSKFTYSVFQNPSSKELQKIISTAVYSNEKILIEYKEGNYHIENEKKTFEVKEINYNIIAKKLKLEKNIKHKK